MSLKSPLGRALGRGSAHNGSGHWRAQRLTALAILPLGLWFALAVLRLPAFDYHTVDAWLAAPGHALPVLLLFLALVYHSSLGLQVVVEDYVHHAGLRAATLAGVWLAHAALAVAGVYSVFRIAAGAAA